jgi:predicted dehydrogenase
MVPSVRTLRRIVAEERYGPLGLFFQSFFKARGGPYNVSPHMHLWQQGVHELDTLLGVVQRRVKKVWGLSNNPAWCTWPSPSTIQAIIECEGSVSGSHLSTSNSRGAGFEFRLECENAALIARDRASGPIEVRWGPKERRSEEIPADGLDTDRLEHHPLAAAVKAGDEKVSNRFIDLQIYRDLYEYVVEGTAPESTGKENLHTIRLLDAIQRSTEQGKPVELAA